MQIKGYVEKIIYTNSDNGHTILDVSLTSDEIKRLQAECPDYADDIDEEMVCVGTLHLINAGEYVVLTVILRCIRHTASSSRLQAMRKAARKIWIPLNGISVPARSKE